MTDDIPEAPPVDAPQPLPEQIVAVQSPEELAMLIYEALSGLKAPYKQEDGSYLNVPPEIEGTMQFLAGVISSLQLQNMQMLGYMEYLQSWCETVTPTIRKMNARIGAPWHFSIWSQLNGLGTDEEKIEFIRKMREQNKEKAPKIIILGD